MQFAFKAKAQIVPAKDLGNDHGRGDIGVITKLTPGAGLEA